MNDAATRSRDALKALREQRGTALAAAQARLKEQNRVVGELTRRLKDGPKTVPELAEATELPSEAIFWQLMALKKYGKVAEADQDGDYFRYRLTEP